MTIATPISAEELPDLNLTQEQLIKSICDGYGLPLLNGIKDANDITFPFVDVKMVKNSIYFGRCSNGNVNDGDTITDGKGNVFTIQMVDTDTVPIDVRFRISLVEDVAHVSRLIPEPKFYFKHKFGSAGSGNGQFNINNGIFVTKDYIYVADGNNNRIQKFTLDGVYVSQFGTFGTGNGQFNGVTGIFVDSTYIYAIDSNNNRVQKFTLAGVYVSKFGTAGSGNGQFNNPSNLWVTSSNIYVADTGNNRIQIFSLTGTYQGQFGTSGTNDGQFDAVSCVCRADDQLYTFEKGANRRVQVFSPSGTFLFKFGANGSGDGQFGGSSNGMYVYGNNIYIIDGGNYRLQVFDRRGTFLTKFGSNGSNEGEFNLPLYLYLFDDFLYISDTFNSRIQKFNLCLY